MQLFRINLGLELNLASESDQQLLHILTNSHKGLATRPFLEFYRFVPRTIFGNKDLSLAIDVRTVRADPGNKL